MTTLVVLSAIGAAVSLVYYLVATLAAARFALRSRAATPALRQSAPAIALLKPLRALDGQLLLNLESFAAAAYPRSQIVLGVAPDEPAQPIAREFALKYQERGVTIVGQSEPDAVNHKVGKLIRMVESAPDADIFVVSDADVRVEPDYLARVVDELVSDASVGVVTCAYRARAGTSLASRLEAMFINTDFAPMVLISEALEPMRHALGATMAVRRTTLEAIGGFRAFKDCLADDFFLGRRAAEHGYKVRLSSALVTITCGERHLAGFWSHQLRWARTYRTVRPVSLATIVVHGPFWALVLLLASGFSFPALAVLLFVLAARITTAAYVTARVLKLPEMARDSWLVPLKDLVMTAIWLASLTGKTVWWGGRRFRILTGGTMREVAG